MDSPGSARNGGGGGGGGGGANSTMSSTTTFGSSCSHLPHHLQQPSSSSTTDPEVFTSTQNIRPGQAFVSVQTLTKEQFHIAVYAKTKVHDILWKCGERLSLSEDKLFGLAFRQPTEGIGGDQPRHEYYFLDPAAKIMKYAHKPPRFANWNNRSSENRPILVLYFRVRVYIDQVGLLTCPKAREHYYLQLKDNFLDHWAGRQSVSEERCWYMAALALITDKGKDYLGYFRAEHYFPLWVINERGLEYIRNNLRAACEDIINEGQDKSMEKFMIEAGRSPFALNCHLYGLRRHKMDNVDNAVLGINAKGIEMCDIGENGDRIPLRSLQWNKVTRLSFDRKKLSILGADGTKMSLYAQTESKAKYLLELCRAVHQTLLVMSHLYATMAPPPKPYQEMSVDGISTSSTSGIGSGDHEKDCDSLSSAGGERCHGSISSKLRMRIKMDSNLDVKIEKMELEHIRQERAASQSSKASDESDRSRLENNRYPLHYHPSNESSNGTNGTIIDNATTATTTTATTTTTTRPSSIDNASQTIESGNTRNIVDVNFNKNNGQISTISNYQIPQFHSMFSSKDNGTPTTPTTSGQDSTEVLESSHQQQWQPRQHTISTSTSSSHQIIGMNTAMTRSDTRIDAASDMMNFEVWQRAAAAAVAANIPNSTNGLGLTAMTNGVGVTPGRFVKKNSAGSRAANAINRVHSMPSHYHVNGYIRQNPIMPINFDDTTIHNYSPIMGQNHLPIHGPTTLTHSLSLHAQPTFIARPRHPPPYNMAPRSVSPPSSSSSSGPITAEVAGGQPSFPPASATPTQFVDETSETFQNCPLLYKLWKEQMNIPAGYAGMPVMKNKDNGTLSHHRRPSSCIDLSLLDQGFGSITSPMSSHSSLMPIHRGQNGIEHQKSVQHHPHQHHHHQFFDSAAIQQNSMMGGSNTITSSIISNANGSASQMISKNLARVEQQHNGNIHLPPPPPYQQPQQMVN